MKAMKLSSHGGVLASHGGLSALLGGVLACGLMLASSSFAAQDTAAPKDCPHHPMIHNFAPGAEGRPLGHLMKDLDLTDAQKATLKTQREAEAKSRDQLEQKLSAARDALHSAVTEGASEAKLQSLSASLGKLEGERALQMAKAQKAFLAVLTPEQKQKLEALKSEREQKMKARMDKHRQFHNQSSEESSES